MSRGVAFQLVFFGGLGLFLALVLTSVRFAPLRLHAVELSQRMLPMLFGDPGAVLPHSATHADMVGCHPRGLAQLSTFYAIQTQNNQNIQQNNNRKVDDDDAPESFEDAENSTTAAPSESPTLSRARECMQRCHAHAASALLFPEFYTEHPDVFVDGEFACHSCPAQRFSSRKKAAKQQPKQQPPHTDPGEQFVYTVEKWAVDTLLDVGKGDLRGSLGRVLDASASLNSMVFLARLLPHGLAEHIDATTWAERGGEQIRKRMSKHIDAGTVRVFPKHYWGRTATPPALASSHETYDTVFLHHYIGTINGFDPYALPRALPAIIEHLRPGGYLVLFGLEPVSVRQSNLFSTIARMRDSCILASGSTPHREYPIANAADMLRANGLNVLRKGAFPVISGPARLSNLVAACEKHILAETADSLMTASERTFFLGQMSTLSRAIAADPQLASSGLCAGVEYVLIARK